MLFDARSEVLSDFAKEDMILSDMMSSSDKTAIRSINIKRDPLNPQSKQTCIANTNIKITPNFRFKSSRHCLEGYFKDVPFLFCLRITLQKFEIQEIQAHSI